MAGSPADDIFAIPDDEFKSMTDNLQSLRTIQARLAEQAAPAMPASQDGNDQQLDITHTIFKEVQGSLCRYCKNYKNIDMESGYLICESCVYRVVAAYPELLRCPQCKTGSRYVWRDLVVPPLCRSCHHASFSKTHRRVDSANQPVSSSSNMQGGISSVVIRFRPLRRKTRSQRS